MRAFRLGLVPAVVAASCLLVACGGDDSGGGSGSGDTVEVAYVAPLSGPAEIFGKPNYLAFKDYIDEVNEKGGVDGKQIKILSEDDKCAPDQGNLIVRNMISKDNVKALIGLPCAAVASAVPSVVSSGDLPVVSTSASGADADNPAENMFYVSPSTFTQGRALARWAESELGAKRIALLRASDAYGELSHDGIVSFLDDQGLELVADETADREATDITAQFATIEKSNPDAVILAVYPETGALYLRQASQANFDVPALAMGAAEPARTLVGPKLVENFYTVTAYAAPVGSKEMQPYVDEFVANHPEYKENAIPPITFVGRSEAELLVEAIGRVDGELTRESLTESLRSITDFQPEAPTAPCPFDFSRPGNEGMDCATLIRFEGEEIVPVEVIRGDG